MRMLGASQRLVALVLGVTLSLGAVTSAAAVPTRWVYGHNYIFTNGPLGLWQVVSYYHIRLNGLVVELTEPMDCEVPYAVGLSISITHCTLDTVYQYVAPIRPYLIGRYVKRWRVTTHWRQCFLHPVFGVCSTHGHSLTMSASGYTTEKRSW